MDNWIQETGVWRRGFGRSCAFEVTVTEKVFQVTRLDEIVKAVSVQRNRRLRTEPEGLGKRDQPAKETKKRAASVGGRAPLQSGTWKTWAVHQRGGMTGDLEQWRFLER